MKHLKYWHAAKEENRINLLTVKRATRNTTFDKLNVLTYLIIAWDPIPAQKACVVASLLLQVSSDLRFYDNDMHCELQNRVGYFRGNWKGHMTYFPVWGCPPFHFFIFLQGIAWIKNDQRLDIMVGWEPLKLGNYVRSRTLTNNSWLNEVWPYSIWLFPRVDPWRCQIGQLPTMWFTSFSLFAFHFSFSGI